MEGGGLMEFIYKRSPWQHVPGELLHHLGGVLIWGWTLNHKLLRASTWINVTDQLMNQAITQSINQSIPYSLHWCYWNILGVTAYLFTQCIFDNWKESRTQNWLVIMTYEWHELRHGIMSRIWPNYLLTHVHMCVHAHVCVCQSSDPIFSLCFQIGFLSTETECLSCDHIHPNSNSGALYPLPGFSCSTPFSFHTILEHFQFCIIYR